MRVPPVRGRGKASRATLIWGRSPAREDGGVGPFTGETFLNRASSFNPPPFSLLLYWNWGPVAPASGTARRAGPGRREGSLEDVTPGLGPSTPCFPATAALQFGAEPASPEPALRGSPRRLAGRGRDVPFPPLMLREMREYPKNTHLKGAGEQRRFLNALTFQV